MMSQGGAGAFLLAQERPGPGAVPIEPLIIAPENPVPFTYSRQPPVGSDSSF
jgi:hypothetical protein